jgi:hypothetical protein
MSRTKISLMAVAVLLFSAVPSHAWHGRGGFGGRFFVGVGPGWWEPPYAYVYGPPAYVYSPPPFIVEQPPVIVQQQPPPAKALAASSYYYCASARAYYPTVPTCAEDWINVPPPR